MVTHGQVQVAVPDERERLGELAYRSKAYWGYPESFMTACREELAVDDTAIRAQRVFVWEVKGRILGFYSLEDLADGGVELGHLFVEPECIGAGVGRRLLEHARGQARQLGFERLVIQGDPNAGAFYVRCGAVRVGERASASIAGRTLPVFEIELGADGGYRGN